MPDPALEVIAKTMLRIRPAGKIFSAAVVCRHCRTELARSSDSGPIHESEKEWVESMRIWRAGRCPKGCPGFRHGLNFETDVIWTEIEPSMTTETT